MPTISMFYGIIIRMYYAPTEHPPPHIHVYFNEYKATFRIDTLEWIQDTLPRRQRRLVQAWAEIHQDELKANWQLAMEGETLFRIPPLQ